MRPVQTVILVAAVMSVAACSNRGLRDLRTNQGGPDEFLVMPAKPLTQPETYATLPTPTPGGTNLTDQNPVSDAVIALGGRPETASAGGVPAADGALVQQASRHGVAPDTRQTLAEADAKFRKRQSRLTRIKLFRVDRYEQAYRRQAMDPFEQRSRFRRAGIPTPAAPPERN